jgi:hypothetical protein
MASTNDSPKSRGLKKGTETARRVAKMGGEAYHEKRGRKGSDSHRPAAM